MELQVAARRGMPVPKAQGIKGKVSHAGQKLSPYEPTA